MYILCIYYVYIMYILCIYYVYIMYILCIYYVYIMYSIYYVYIMYSIYYVYIMYILCIYYVYIMYILCIYYVYIMYILCIYYVYIMYILCTVYIMYILLWWHSQYIWKVIQNSMVPVTTNQHNQLYLGLSQPPPPLHPFPVASALARSSGLAVGSRPRRMGLANFLRNSCRAPKTPPVTGWEAHGTKDTMASSIRYHHIYIYISSCFLCLR